VEDAALSAFSLFLSQSTFFFGYQQRMQKNRNRNNAR
jgi:hypothetical protein